MAGLQIPLPLLNRNQGNIEAAAAEIRAADSALAATEALIRAEVLAAQAEVQMRYRQINDLLRSASIRAAESSRIALAAYREGGTDLLKLLDAELPVPRGQTLLLTALDRARALRLHCTLHRRPGAGPERAVIVGSFEPRLHDPQPAPVYRQVAAGPGSRGES